MSLFSPNHLLDYELDYELAIRGVITQRNVTDKRKILGKLLKKERDAGVSGSQVCFDEYDYNPKSEEQGINKSISSISELIDEFEGTTSDSVFARIKSRINHLSGRINRLEIPEDGDEILNFKRESYATCLKLESELDDKVVTESISPTNANCPNVSQPVVNLNPVISCSANKQPISDWGVKFTGDPKKLFYFLERVSDLSQSRNVSNGELFNSAVELFVGDAFVWYRSIKNTVNDWDSLVSRLKQDFLPPYSDDDIWENIRQRKQKRSESTVIFISHMKNLFDRLSLPVTEVTKLKYIKRNLLPEYVQQLALHPVDNISALTDLCKSLEEASYITSRKSNNPQISSLNKPVWSKKGKTGNPYSSACDPSTSTSKSKPHTFTPVSDNAVVSNSSVICFNCQMPNHTYQVCSKKRGLFCFRCGEQNVKVSSCPKCSKN